MTAIGALAALLGSAVHPQKALRLLMYSAGALILSGASLALLSPEVSALSLCDDLALYVSLYAIAGAILYRHVASESKHEAFRMPVAAVALSMIVFAGTTFVGL